MACAPICGLILLGNSGVGKSFLANRLLDDDEAFESRFSARSVTRHTEWKILPTAIGKYNYSVANIPGLVEANQTLIDENRTEIMKAFEECPFAIVFFVLGHNNGRIPDEDLVAFMRINDAYQFPSKSLFLIINGIPSNRPDDYKEKTAQLLHELTHVDKSLIYFIEKTTSEESKKEIRDLLHEAVRKCEPTYHTKKHDIELLADEISRLKMESKQRQEQLLAQEDKYSKKQKLNLTHPDSSLELHRSSSEQFLTATIDPKSDMIDQQKQFEEIMKDMETAHDQNIKELKKIQHNSNIDAIKQFTQQREIENGLNKQLLDHISSSPDVIIVCEQQRGNNSQTKTKAFIKGVVGAVTSSIVEVFRGESRSRESKNRQTSNHDRNEQNFQSSTPRSSNPHHQNPTND